MLRKRISRFFSILFSYSYFLIFLPQILLLHLREKMDFSLILSIFFSIMFFRRRFTCYNGR